MDRTKVKHTNQLEIAQNEIWTPWNFPLYGSWLHRPLQNVTQADMIVWSSFHDPFNNKQLYQFTDISYLLNKLFPGNLCYTMKDLAWCAFHVSDTEGVEARILFHFWLLLTLPLDT